MENKDLLAAILILIVIIIEIAAFKKWILVRRFSLVKTERLISAVYIIHIATSVLLLSGMISLIFYIDISHLQNAMYIFILNCLVFLATLYVYLVKIKLEEKKLKKQSKGI
jgi:Ca2+/Na+ antiporter